MELKKSNNFILTRLLPEIDSMKGKVMIAYKYSDIGIKIKGKNVDVETVAMFSLGTLFEIYDKAKGHPIFDAAFIECLEALLKIAKENQKDGEL